MMYTCRINLLLGYFEPDSYLRLFYPMDCKPVICYVYTSVSCYAIVYNGFGDSGIQRGRYVWLELCTLFGDYATSTPHHLPK